LCDEFDGSRLSHACVLRRGLESGIEQKDVCMVGLRSWEIQELDLIENGQLNVYPMPMVAGRGIQAIAAEVKQKLSACDAVHISLDIDCLDPAAAPGTFLNPQAALNLRYVIQCPARPPGFVQL
jgi:arginase family enzyme